MLSNNKDWFVRSSFGNNYSRTLLRMGGEFLHQIDISVEPINDYPDEWEQLLECRIRKHMTHEDPQHFSHAVPQSIHEILTGKFDQDVADFLIHEDIYNMIDWGKFRDAENSGLFSGGVPLMVILKDNNETTIPSNLINYWSNNEKVICGEYKKLRKAALNDKLGVLGKHFGSDYYGIFGKFIDKIVTTSDSNTRKMFELTTTTSHKGTAFEQEASVDWVYCLGNVQACIRIGLFAFVLLKQNDEFSLYKVKNFHDDLPLKPDYKCKVNNTIKLLEYISQNV